MPEWSVGGGIVRIARQIPLCLDADKGVDFAEGVCAVWLGGHEGGESGRHCEEVATSKILEI